MNKTVLQDTHEGLIKCYQAIMKSGKKLNNTQQQQYWNSLCWIIDNVTETDENKKILAECYSTRGNIYRVGGENYFR